MYFMGSETTLSVGKALYGFGNVSSLSVGKATFLPVIRIPVTRKGMLDSSESVEQAISVRSLKRS